ncbi:MAG TPA: dihydropteroate synthase [Oscillospiraceae bacterium]|nr:dihydropteroate synthase [Oscillospiraceae bacterium]
MIILGEKLNSSIPSTLEAINSKNDEYIISLCKKQEECGAHYLDINTALADDELEAMLYVLKLAQDNTECGIMLDSPNVEVVKEAIKHIKGRSIIINSITLDERHELIDTAKEYDAGLVALPLTEDGIPETPEERLENAKKLVEIVSAKGIEIDKLYIDIIVEALAVNGEAGKRAIETARLIRNEFPEVHLTCGLSNISFGLPKRVNINTAFIPALMCAGVDSAIIDITSERTQDMIAASKALCGIDEYCMEYIERFR